MQSMRESWGRTRGRGRGGGLCEYRIWCRAQKGAGGGQASSSIRVVGSKVGFFLVRSLVRSFIYVYVYWGAGGR